MRWTVRRGLPAAGSPLFQVGALIAEGGGAAVAGQHDSVVLEAAEELFEHVGEELAELLRGVGLAHAAGEEGIAGEQQGCGGAVFPGGFEGVDDGSGGVAGHVQGADDGVREVEVEAFAAGQFFFDGVVFQFLNLSSVSCTRGGHGTGEVVELLNSADVVPVAVSNQNAGQTNSAGPDGVEVLFLLHDAHAAFFTICQFELRAVVQERVESECVEFFCIVCRVDEHLLAGGAHGDEVDAIVHLGDAERTDGQFRVLKDEGGFGVSSHSSSVGVVTAQQAPMRNTPLSAHSALTARDTCTGCMCAGCMCGMHREQILEHAQYRLGSARIRFRLDSARLRVQ
ncbi:hypothetical protein RMDY18_09230 [Rothia mucilaginosa DY-18]|uniref:Uncharacterized protein n=1 Tax=Rothia mucilaginosa (strain DY-18) TaxID=680646 RepID=D2NSX9_ROTMD|nr:hypothetical protein RMDY18_09230 [Rothia mucilaginosa DY-18]